MIAEAIGGSEEEFARAMTRKARALGMRNTTYRNATGLPNDEQITTARDQALLGIAIQERFPKYYRYFSLASFVYRGNAMRNHNHLLGKVEGVDGIKTGYTRDSGFNLVTSVKRGARHIVAVVLGGRSAGSRDARMRDLIDSQHRRGLDQAAGVALVAEAESRKPQRPRTAAKPQLAVRRAARRFRSAQPLAREVAAAIVAGLQRAAHAGQGQDRRRSSSCRPRTRPTAEARSRCQPQRRSPCAGHRMRRWRKRSRPPRRSSSTPPAPSLQPIRRRQPIRAFSASCRP